MPEVIVDTSALVAFFVQSEQHHPAARLYAAQNPGMRWIILETVFDEFVTWVRAEVSISSSIQVGRILREEHLYVNISDAADAATWEAFCRYDDKRWSYTDCSILVMVHGLGVSEVFAFDEHIEQMSGWGSVACHDTVGDSVQSWVDARGCRLCFCAYETTDSRLFLRLTGSGCAKTTSQ
jgi:predicted nucleic acid-binding protein